MTNTARASGLQGVNNHRNTPIPPTPGKSKAFFPDFLLDIWAPGTFMFHLQMSNY